MRTRNLRSIALAVITLGLAAAASGLNAQSIYRCGDSYSQQPCAGGQPVAGPPPSPADSERARSLANTRRDAALADTMEKDRLRQEAKAPKAYLPPPKHEAPREPHRWPEKAGTRKLDVFTAVAPGSVPAKKKPEKKTGTDAGKKAATVPR